MNETDKCFGFGKLLKHTRKNAGLTQTQMAMRLHVTPSHISNVEHGKHEASQAVKALFYQSFQNEAEASLEPTHSQEKADCSLQVLLEEITLARLELSSPMNEAEADELARATGVDILQRSALLREAMEVRSTRELLAGAQAFRKKREAAKQSK